MAGRRGGWRLGGPGRRPNSAVAVETGALMSKDEVLAAFDEALRRPEAAKSGNLLADELRRRASVFAMADRVSLVEAVREWLDSHDELLAMQAAVLAREFLLGELREAIERVRNEVASGEFMKPSSTWLFDRTLESLK